MALTRPRLGQIYTNITALTDAISVLNAGATQANVDVGFLVNRAHGLVSNAAIYYSETLDTFVTAFTSNSGGTDSNIVISSFTDFTTGNVYTTGLYWNGNGQPITFASGSTYSNVNVAAYLAGNVTTGNISADGFYFSNGTPFISGSGSGTYGNVDVTAFLPTYTGDLNPGNITATGNIVGGGVRTTTGTTEPANPVPGDMWYDTANDVLFRYTDLGTGSYWLDITGETTLYISSGNVTFGNVTAQGFYFANGTPFISGGGGGSDYGNANVAAYLDSYFIYANANASTQTTAFTTLDANVGAYQIWANANAVTQQTLINSIDANIGAYQLYANANAASQQTQIDSINANVAAANIVISTKAPTESPTFTGNAIMANLTVGNLVVQGNTTTIGTTDLTIQDSIIHLHTFANLAPLTVDDGRDVGIAMHYYKSGDGTAFLGWANDSGYLEYYAAGNEVGNVFTGTAYGTVKAGELLAVNTTPSTSTTTGALVISGGAGIAGNLFASSIYSNTYFFANGTPFVSSNYGNLEVSAYLDSYYLYANANAASQQTSIDSINANVGTYQTHANANAATQQTAINSINANIGAYQLYANANIGTIKTDLTTLQSNVGEFEAYANATFSTSSYGNTQLAAYLLGNITTGNVSATGYYFANGTPFTSSSYGNTNVAAYLPTYTGNLNPGNITASGNIVGGGVRATTGSTEPTNPVPGDIWYDTGSDLLFRYTNLGTSTYWLDITGSTGFTNPYSDVNVAAYLAGNVTVGNLTVNSYVTGNLTPSSNVTYSLGEDGLRWKNLYLSGQTIFLGNSVITEDVSLGTVTIIPPPTQAVPNPVALVISPYGTISTANTLNGQVTGNVTVTNNTTLSNVIVTGNITTNGKVTTSSIYTNNYFYSNGSPFVSSNYGNTQVSAYLAGNTTIGNVTATGYYFANGAPFISGSGSGSSAPRYVTYILSGNINGSKVGTVRYYPPTAMTISNVIASVSTAVSGTNLVFELIKNGTSLGPLYTINTTSYRMNPTAASFSLNTTDYLTVTINSGIASDLRIDLQYT